jgi:hypothetical protein
MPELLGDLPAQFYLHQLNRHGAQEIRTRLLPLGLLRVNPYFDHCRWHASGDGLREHPSIQEGHGFRHGREK